MGKTSTTANGCLWGIFFFVAIYLLTGVLLGFDVYGSFLGKVADLQARDGIQTVRARVPMATMFGYATDLRSQTQGRATYSMQFDHYDEVPQAKADEIVARVTGMTA